MQKPLFIAAVLALTACTPYTSSGLLGGFSETRRADDVYVVRFQGNGFTSQDSVDDMVFLRAAELTLEKGYTHFAIISEKSGADHAFIPTASQSYTTGTVNQWGGFQARTTTTGGTPLMIRYPKASLTIGMSREPVVMGQKLIDAQSVVDDLGKKVK
ncbi:MAG: hypothetical protein QM740_19070 [Acidovorax sp.]